MMENTAFHPHQTHCGSGLRIHLPRLRERRRETYGNHGFTLIELAIVLVVIGLVVGGVLVGQELISKAAVRAQVTQIEKFNAAANAFFGKYGGLPGDLNATAAAQFGFTARAGTAGRGDGNGELDGVNAQGVSWNINGEDMLFWEDLSSARMIDGGFQTYVDNTAPYCGGAASNPSCSAFFPPAKIGNGNMVFVYSGYAPVTCCAPTTGLGPNFFGIEAIASLGSQNVGSGYNSVSAPGLTVAQAYAMDQKTDDGAPMTGRVRAQLLSPTNGVQAWSASAATDSAATCFNTTTNAYSLTQNNGSGVNCGISFQMQAGD